MHMTSRNPLHPCPKRKVLVLGDDERQLLPVIRSLGRRGIEVHLAWCPGENPAARSRYLSKLHALPLYVPQETAWKLAFTQLLEAQRYDLILPATEGAVHILQTHRHELADSESMYLLADAAYRVVSSKRETYELAASLGIPCPESQRVSHDADIEAQLRQLPLPLVIKPCSSVCDHGQLTKHFVRTAHTREDAAAYLRYLASSGADALLQPYFLGVGVGVELLADQGQVLVACSHQRLHETNGYGSTYRETTAIDPALLGACKKLIHALNYSGVAMVEFRVNRESGKWKLLEINGRFWGSLPLAVAAGVDFPGYLYEMLCQRRRTFPQRYRAGVRSRMLAGDLRWTWRRLRRKGRAFLQENPDCLGWGVNQVPLTRTCWHLLRGLLLADRIDTFAWDDPLPACHELKALFAQARTRCARLWRWRPARSSPATTRAVRPECRPANAV